MTPSKFIDNHSIKIEPEKMTDNGWYRIKISKAGRVLYYFGSFDTMATKSRMFKAWYSAPYVSQEVVRHLLGGRCYNTLCKLRGMKAGSGRRQPAKLLTAAPMF